MWSRPRAHVRNAVVTCLTPLSAMRVFLQNWAAVEQFAQLCYNPTPSLVSACPTFEAFLYWNTRTGHARHARRLFSVVGMLLPAVSSVDRVAPLGWTTSQRIMRDTAVWKLKLTSGVSQVTLDPCSMSNENAGSQKDDPFYAGGSQYAKE
jgi:hypothetical protein